jgi:hypothetical protein
VDKEIFVLADGNKPDQSTKVTINAQSYCGYAGPIDPGKSVLNLTLRSVEGVVRFLGAVTRIELGLDGAVTTSPTVYFDQRGLQSATLFQVTQGPVSGAAVNIVRGAATYSVALDKYPNNLSGKVLSFLLEAVNLNNSAKDQPTPNVISVIAP